MCRRVKPVMVEVLGELDERLAFHPSDGSPAAKRDERHRNGLTACRLLPAWWDGRIKSVWLRGPQFAQSNSHTHAHTYIPMLHKNVCEKIHPGSAGLRIEIGFRIANAASFFFFFASYSSSKFAHDSVRYKSNQFFTPLPAPKVNGAKRIKGTHPYGDGAWVCGIMQWSASASIMMFFLNVIYLAKYIVRRIFSVNDTFYHQ